MTDPLNPCPFCGEAVQRRDALWPSDGDQDAVIHAAPSDCPMQVFSDGTWGGSLYGRWNGGLDATAAEHVRALLADDEAEAIICAVGVKHCLNIHPAIARDIAAALRRKAGIE